MSKHSDLVLWYAPDGSYGVCQKHEVVTIPLDCITDNEHDMIDAADCRDQDIVSLLDRIAFRIVNADANADVRSWDV